MYRHLCSIKSRIEHLAFSQVIYGDTDSIMIHSGLDDIEEVKAIKSKVIQEVGWIIDLSLSFHFLMHPKLKLSMTKPIHIQRLEL